VNRSDLGWTVAFGLLLALVAMWKSGEAAVERADALASAIPALLDARDSLKAVTDSTTAVADSVRAAHSADSARWATERATARQRLADAQRTAHTVALDLTARLDSAEAALFVAYEASRDSVDAVNSQVIASLEDETASLYLRVGSLEDALAATMNELGAERAVSMQYAIVNEALRGALRRQARTSTFYKLGTLAGVVYVIADMAGG